MKKDYWVYSLLCLIMSQVTEQNHNWLVLAWRICALGYLFIGAFTDHE